VPVGGCVGVGDPGQVPGWGLSRPSLDVWVWVASNGNIQPVPKVVLDEHFLGASFCHPASLGAAVSRALHAQCADDDGPFGDKIRA
jgi:hypothetical protein